MSRHLLIEGFCAACKPADRPPPWQWCEEHVQVDETSPLPGRWRSDASPWVKPFLGGDSGRFHLELPLPLWQASDTSETQTIYR